MSYTTSPIQAMFEMQRQSIEHGQQLLEQSIDYQQNAAKTFLQNGLAAQRSAQRQGSELARQVSDAQFEAIEESVEDDELRSKVDQQVQETASRTQDILNAQFEQGTDLFQELLHAQFDALEKAVDDDEFDVRETVDRQFAEFDRSQEAAWDEFEAEFVEAVDDLSDQQKVLLAESIESMIDAQVEAQEQTVESVQQVEETVESVQEQSQDVTESVQQGTRGFAEEAAEATEEVADANEAVAAETTEAIEEAAEQGSEVARENLQALEGVGSTYADRLAAIGIDTVADLADAQTTAIAEAAEISQDRADEWIEAAQAHSEE